jgi:hypothetical protein
MPLPRQRSVLPWPAEAILGLKQDLKKFGLPLARCGRQLLVVSGG